MHKLEQKLDELNLRLLIKKHQIRRRCTLIFWMAVALIVGGAGIILMGQDFGDRLIGITFFGCGSYIAQWTAFVFDNANALEPLPPPEQIEAILRPKQH